MPRRTNKKESAAKTKRTRSTSSQTVTRVERMDDTANEQSAFERISDVFQRNQSFFNIILGGLIVVVLAVLLFNYFNKPTEDLVTPATQTETQQATGDVSKENLPGNYTIKEGDTLFSIAQNYYDDGYKYPEIVKANGLSNENSIEVGQALTIPKLDEMGTAETAQASVEPSATPQAVAQATKAPTSAPEAVAQATQAPIVEGGTGGAINQTAWGTKIEGDTYTVQAEDWLSKIAGRAYGDITQYQRIAQANNIANPDQIEVGTVLKIPR